MTTAITYAAPNKSGQLRRHLAREVRFVRRELHHHVIDRPKLVNRIVVHVQSSIGARGPVVLS